jgi:GNAT superfamily N-acetyltransferase
MQLRHANMSDVDAIEEVMRDSIEGISSRTYDAAQVEASLRYVARFDRTLVEDGTYFVVEIGGEIAGCGGWSKRGRLYTGSGSGEGDARLLDPRTEPARVRMMFVRPRYERRGIGRLILDACENEARAAGFGEMELMAMLSGHAMYLACRYRDVEEVAGALEDGTPFPLFRMRKSL